MTVNRNGRTYSRTLLASNEESEERAVERIALSCDSRIPRESIKYVDDLVGGRCTLGDAFARMSILASYVRFVD